MEKFDRGIGAPGRAERAPIFNVPSVLALLIAVIVACHFALSIVPHAWQLWINHFGSLSPRLLLSGPKANGGFLFMALPLVTHIFIHANWSHLLLNSVWLLAFGAPVAIRLGAQRRLFDSPSAVFLLFFILSGVFGALTFAAMNASLDTQLVGASGGVSGLLGALVRTIFVRQADLANVRRTFARLTDTRVIIATIVILASNLIAALFGGLLTSGENDIAWEAHMGGYLFGLLTFPVFAALARPK